MIVLIEWLRQRGILDFVNALMTVSISFFALVQLLLSARDRRDRTRAAIAAFQVEFWRVWAVSERWRKEDLEKLNEHGLFDPEDIMPRDWGAILPLLGEMGAVPSGLAGIAYAFAADAANHGRSFQRIAQVQAEAAQAKSVPDVVAKLQSAKEKAIASAREKSRLAADTLQDATQHVPRWAKVTKIDSSLLKSDPGKKLASLIETRHAQLSRWTRIKRWLGRA